MVAATRTRREKTRDMREYDTTQLKENQHAKFLHRDYSAHFFRWSFARRFITVKDVVLEIGCGEDKPLSKIFENAFTILKIFNIMTIHIVDLMFEH